MQGWNSWLIRLEPLMIKDISRHPLTRTRLPELIGNLQGTYREVIGNITRSNTLQTPSAHRVVVIEQSVWVHC